MPQTRAPRDQQQTSQEGVPKVYTTITEPLPNRYENRSRKSRRESFNSYARDVLIQVEGREIDEPTGLTVPSASELEGWGKLGWMVSFLPSLLDDIR